MIPKDWDDETLKLAETFVDNKSKIAENVGLLRRNTSFHVYIVFGLFPLNDFCCHVSLHEQFFMLLQNCFSNKIQVLFK